MNMKFMYVNTLAKKRSTVMNMKYVNTVEKKRSTVMNMKCEHS